MVPSAARWTSSKPTAKPTRRTSPIKVGGHPFPLHVKYKALIDGTNGDTHLKNIDAWFLSSYLHAVGAVLDGPKGERGRTVSLDVAMDKSRIEDIMKMAVKSATPPMTGALKMNTKFLLPPGEADVVDRLRLDGQFWIDQATFTSYDVQGKIEELSKRASAKTAASTRDRVVSNFQGKFKLADGRLVLPDLTFEVPGAKVQLAGGYALVAETLDFKGPAASGREDLRNRDRHQVGAPEGRRPALQAERRLRKRDSDQNCRLPQRTRLRPGREAGLQEGQLSVAAFAQPSARPFPADTLNEQTGSLSALSAAAPAGTSGPTAAACIP